MSIATCTTCGKQYRLTPELVGKRVRCQACGNVFVAAAPEVDLSFPTAPLQPSMPQPPIQPFANSSSIPPFGNQPIPNGYGTPSGGGMVDGGARGRTVNSDVIDYEIFGQEMQYCEITLDPGEMVIAEAGAMMYMTQGIKMETMFGDPSQKSQGFWGKLASAGKRAITGESVFITTFSNQSSVRERVAFAAPYPGKIIPLHLHELGGEVICQKDAFLCGARGTQVGIAFQKKIGVGLFGGEGFIMQRITGDGIVLVHAGGTLMHRTLQAGEVLKLDTGCLVGLTPSVGYNIEMVGGVKNTLFGGEGLFLATLTGPGQIWIQSLPFSRFAGRVVANSGGGGGKDEGSLLGTIGSVIMGASD